MLIISSPSSTHLAVIGCEILSEGTPPPKYIYAFPSSSTRTAGSNNHNTSAQLGVFLVISPWPSGSLKGPVGESASRTPIPPPPSAKYRKNLSCPSIFFHAAAGAHEFFAHFAPTMPSATYISP